MRDAVAAIMFITMLFAIFAGGAYVTEFWPAYTTAGPMPEPVRPDGPLAPS